MPSRTSHVRAIRVKGAWKLVSSSDRRTRSRIKPSIQKEAQPPNRWEVRDLQAGQYVLGHANDIRRGCDPKVQGKR